MTEEEELRVALKKAHEIKTKLDDFIIHLSEVYKRHYAKASSRAVKSRDTLEKAPSPDDYETMSGAKNEGH
jgi:hypothetical protein